MEAAIVVCSRDLRRHDNPALHQALAACPSDLVDVPTYLFLVQGDIDHVWRSAAAWRANAAKRDITGIASHHDAPRTGQEPHSAAAPVSIC